MRERGGSKGARNPLHYKFLATPLVTVTISAKMHPMLQISTGVE